MRRKVVYCVLKQNKCHHTHEFQSSLLGIGSLPSLMRESLSQTSAELLSACALCLQMWKNKIIFWTALTFPVFPVKYSHR